MKRIALAILLATAPLTSLATGSWVVGINYMNLSEDVDAFDVSLGGLAGSVGHKVNIVDNFYLIPEVRFGTGISDDTVRYLGVSVDLELDRFIALSVRGQYEFDNNLYQIHIVRALTRSEEHTSELQSRGHLVCRLLLEKKNI